MHTYLLGIFNYPKMLITFMEYIVSMFKEIQSKDAWSMKESQQKQDITIESMF